MLRKNGYPYWEYKDVLASNPNYVVIELGTNDFKRWLWDALGSEFKNDYMEMIQSFQNLPSKPEVYIGLLIPCKNPD